MYLFNEGFETRQRGSSKLQARWRSRQKDTERKPPTPRKPSTYLYPPSHPTFPPTSPLVQLPASPPRTQPSTPSHAMTHTLPHASVRPNVSHASFPGATLSITFGKSTLVVEFGVDRRCANAGAMLPRKANISRVLAWQRNHGSCCQMDATGFGECGIDFWRWDWGLGPVYLLRSLMIIVHEVVEQGEDQCRSGESENDSSVQKIRFLVFCSGRRQLRRPRVAGFIHLQCDLSPRVLAIVIEHPCYSSEIGVVQVLARQGCENA